MVQFILSDNLDGNLSTSLALDSLVDVREGTVTHLFDKSETLESLQSARTPRIPTITHLVYWHLLALSSLVRNNLLGFFSVIRRGYGSLALML